MHCTSAIMVTFYSTILGAVPLTNMIRPPSPGISSVTGLLLSHATLLRPGSQSDARPCIALIRETHKFITKKAGDFLTTKCKNATQRNVRIRSESILALCCVLTRRRRNATHCLASYCKLAFTVLHINELMATSNNITARI